jgi:bacterioferritin-associated ferredoxin
LYVCICAAVDESEVHRSLHDGARTPAELASRCGAGTGCGSCRMRLCDMIRSFDERRREPVAAAS